MGKDKKASEGLIHSLTNRPRPGKTAYVPLKRAGVMLLILLLLGVGTGYVGATLTGQSQETVDVTEQTQEETEKDIDEVPKTAGVDDPDLFTDSAEGKLVEGGVQGEGEYHLERPGGESQNVYLTSTTVDLSKYLGKEVSVKGQTFNAQVAGWFMEVGYLEVLE